jgi:WD40 repeat protein
MYTSPTLQGGIKAIDISPASSSVVATAGGDGIVAVYDSAAGRLLSELRGHTKKVNGECHSYWYWSCTKCCHVLHASSLSPGICTALCCSHCSWFDKRLSKVGGCFADVKFFGSQDVLVSASSDNTSRIWRASGDDGAMVAAAVLKTHSAEARVPSPVLHTIQILPYNLDLGT